MPSQRLKVIVSAAAIVLIGIHWIAPKLGFDAITWGLIGLAVVPWLTALVHTAEFGGWKIEFRELQLKQKEQQNELFVLKFLLNYLVTDDELGHLKRFLSHTPWPFQRDSTTRFFEDELRRLRAMKLIAGRPNKGVRSLLEQGGDVKNHFEITPGGKDYLRLREQINSTSEA
jgi:hypothetical protein